MTVTPASFVVIAGPNGSGKSTFTSRIRAIFRNTRGEELSVFDPDREIENLAPETENPNQHIQAVLRRQRDAAIASKTSFSYETVLSHASHVDAMEDARRQGMRVWLFYVTTERAEINLDRVGIRVKDGGHDVPKNKIVERYLKSMALELPRAIAASHHGMLFDNSDIGKEAGRIIDGRLYLPNEAGLDWPETYLAFPHSTFRRLHLLRS